MIATSTFRRAGMSSSLYAEAEPWYGRFRSYRPARTLDEVVGAWSEVYASYRRSGLIGPSPQRVHVMPEAVDPSVLVVVDSGISQASSGAPPGCHRGIATITAIPDVGRGIPLDEIYGEQIDELRRSRREPIEIVLLTDDRNGDKRSMSAVFALMKWTFFYGIYLGKTDLVFGVHPRHVSFYRRMLGAVELGPEKTCPRVQNAPIVGMRLDVVGGLKATRKARAIQHFLTRPIARDEFADRFQLSWASIRGSVIEDYLGVRSDGPWAFRRTTRSTLPSSERPVRRRRFGPSRPVRRRRWADEPGRTFPGSTAHPDSR